MTYDQALKAIIPHLRPCFNDGMKITDEAIDGIITEFKVSPPLADGIRAVAEWFNDQKVSDMCNIDQDRHIGMTINLIILLAIGDLKSLLHNWVFNK